jgi:hypothetical protein
MRMRMTRNITKVKGLGDPGKGKEERGGNSPASDNAADAPAITVTVSEVPGGEIQVRQLSGKYDLSSS